MVVVGGSGLETPLDNDLHLNRQPLLRWYYCKKFISVTFDSCRASQFHGLQASRDQSECHSPQISVSSHVSMNTTERLQPVSGMCGRHAVKDLSTDGKMGHIPLQFLIVLHVPLSQHTAHRLALNCSLPLSV